MFKLRRMENGGNIACTRAALQLITPNSRSCLIDLFSQPEKSESDRERLVWI